MCVCACVLRSSFCTHWCLIVDRRPQRTWWMVGTNYRELFYIHFDLFLRSFTVFIVLDFVFRYCLLSTFLAFYFFPFLRFFISLCTLVLICLQTQIGTRLHARKRGSGHGSHRRHHGTKCHIVGGASTSTSAISNMGLKRPRYVYIYSILYIYIL